ncbi:MAG: antibiotic biosynthesis monooxygenase [Colwellia sp.]|nr:antibiotic biosynthesis monooxygenase [Colwellia sp.]
MFIVANRIPVAQEWQSEFENRFQKRVGEIDKQPGFVSMQILKPISEDAPYVVFTTWQDENAFNEWIKSEDFKISHQNPLPREAFTGRPVIEKHQVVISTNL